MASNLGAAKSIAPWEATEPGNTLGNKFGVNGAWQTQSDAISSLDKILQKS